MTSRPSPRAFFRHWLTLVVYLSAFSLVQHLDQRYAQYGSKDPDVHSKCPAQSWQRLACDALQWSAPAPQAASLTPLPAVSFLERPNEFVPSTFLPAESLYSRPPPPSC